MSSTYSTSYTYSVTDVRKVHAQIQAELRMAADSTGLNTIAWADETMADVLAFAELGYLEKMQIRLVGYNGKNINVAEYVFSENARGWSADRVGGMLWPRNVGSRLTVTLYYSSKWVGIGNAAQEQFKSKQLKGTWSTCTDDLSVSHLYGRDDRTFVSNAYGAQKRQYS
jgi:hypothetical protein